MPIPYNINPVTRGVNGFGLNAPDLVWNVLFDATVEATFTVPNSLPLGAIGKIGRIEPIGSLTTEPIGRNRWIAVFNYGTRTPGNIIVAVNATAVVPTVNNFTAMAGFLMPKAWDVKAGDVIHAISDVTDSLMSVALYNITE